MSDEACCEGCGRPLAVTGWETDRQYRCFSGISTTPDAAEDCAKAKKQADDLAAELERRGLVLDEERLRELEKKFPARRPSGKEILRG